MLEFHYITEHNFKAWLLQAIGITTLGAVLQRSQGLSYIVTSQKSLKHLV